MELVIQEKTYFSQADEASFYGRLEDLKCIRSIIGAPDGLHVRFKRQPTEAQLRELIALFYRYGLDMTPLAMFKNAINSKWFGDRGKFWYSQVFTPKNQRKKKNA